MVKSKGLFHSLLNEAQAVVEKDKLPFPLYPYQIEGVNFLFETKRVILGDDMGLGKTLQAIALKYKLDPEYKQPTLIIAPKNAKAVWKQELKKWANQDAMVLSSKDGSLGCFEQLMNPTSKFIIMNYEQLDKFIDILTKMHYFGLILFDEAHKVRNRNTRRYKNTEKLVKRFSFIPIVFISGTPLVNTPADLFTLLHLIDPNTFGSERNFMSAYFYQRCNDHGKLIWVVRNRERFQEFMKRYMIRRERKDVLDLPPVKKIEVPIALEGKQLAFYKQIRDEAVLSLTEFGEKIPIVHLLALIMRMKQAALSPLLCAGVGSCEGAKTDYLLDLLESLQGKTVIASCFASYLRALKIKLEEIGYTVAIIDGQTNEYMREQYVKDFQEDKIDIFLLSTKAGGESITLTNASNFITIDKDWTPAAEDQVFGRVYRNGQENKIFKYYLKSVNTVEDYIEQVIGAKKQLFSDSIPITDAKKLLFGG